MSADRIFLVKVTHTQEMTVTMTAADHDEAMHLAEHVFPGWEAVEATEDDWRPPALDPSPEEQAVIDRFGIFAVDET